MNSKKPTESPLFGRDAFLEMLNGRFEKQFLDILKDIKDYRTQNKQKDKSPCFFLVYPVSGQDDQILTQETLEKFDVTVSALKKLKSVQKFESDIKAMNLILIFDFYINFSDSKGASPKKYLRLVIEGIEI